MTVTTRVLTFAAGAQQFPALSPVQQVTRIVAQPLRSNTHISYVGISTVTNDASGVGVLQELAQPPAATSSVERFEVADFESANSLDPTMFYGHGTSGEKMLVSYFQR